MKLQRLPILMAGTLATLFATACSSSSVSSANASASLTLQDEYEAQGDLPSSGGMTEVTFHDATHYSLKKTTGCVSGVALCHEYGTYVVDAQAGTMTLTDTTGATRSLPFAATKTSAVQAAPLHLRPLGGGVSLGGGGGGTSLGGGSDAGSLTSGEAGSLTTGDEVSLVVSFTVDGQTFTSDTTLTFSGEGGAGEGGSGDDDGGSSGSDGSSSDDGGTSLTSDGGSGSDGSSAGDGGGSDTGTSLTGDGGGSTDSSTTSDAGANGDTGASSGDGGTDSDGGSSSEGGSTSADGGTTNGEGGASGIDATTSDAGSSDAGKTEAGAEAGAADAGKDAAAEAGKPDAAKDSGKGSSDAGKSGSSDSGSSSKPTPPTTGTAKGVDVSHYQGASINWSTVHAADGFAYTKATEGASYTDDTFGTNWQAMKAAGITRGAYQFFRASQDPIKQADFFVQTIANKGGFLAGQDLAPMVDVEVTDGASAATLVANLRKFIAEAESKLGGGVKLVIYTGPSFWINTLGNPDLSSNPLWIAHYTSAAKPIVPSHWSNYTIWQYTDAAPTSGISAGGVDGDRWNGSAASLQSFVESDK